MPATAKEAGEFAIGEGHVNRATVGTSMRVTGALPAIEQCLHLAHRELGTVADGSTAGEGDAHLLGIFTLGKLNESGQTIVATGKRFRN